MATNRTAHSLCCRLSRDPAQVRRAREQARQALSRWGLGEHADLAELIVSELATNAIRHGQGVVRVCVSYARRHLRVDVHDDGAGRPARQQATRDDESGRGLALLDGLIGLHGGSRGVATDITGHGKTVSVMICLPADPAAVPVTSGIVVFEDTGALLPDGTVIEPHRARSRSPANGLLPNQARPRGAPCRTDAPLREPPDRARRVAARPGRSLVPCSRTPSRKACTSRARR